MDDNGSFENDESGCPERSSLKEEEGGRTLPYSSSAAVTSAAAVTVASLLTPPTSEEELHALKQTIEARGLNHAQRSAIGWEIVPFLREQAQKRALVDIAGSNPPKRSGRRSEAIETAAMIVGASATSVQYARKIQALDPRIFERLKNGEMTVRDAYRAVHHLDTPPKGAFVIRRSREKRVAEIMRLAGEGHRADQIGTLIGISADRVRLIAHAASIKLPDDTLKKSPKINAHRVIEETVSTLEGLALGLKTVSGAQLQCGPEDAREWVVSIDASLRVVNKLRRILRGHYP